MPLVLCPHHRAECDTKFIPCKHGIPHERARACGLVCLHVRGPAGACQSCQPIELQSRREPVQKDTTGRSEPRQAGSPAAGAGAGPAVGTPAARLDTKGVE